MIEKEKRCFLSKETWVFIFLTILAMGVMFKYVDLTPHVDNDFFFSSDDPDLQADNEISRLFARKDSQVIISITGDIFSEEYKSNIEHFCRMLSKFDHVNSVKSITHGPRGIYDAIRSPFWRRILISENKESTNVIVIVNESKTQKLIPKIESLIGFFDEDNFQIKISGFPFIVELIRRNLTTDLNVFSTAALILFGIVVFAIFHSWRILLGMIVACASSCSLTFLTTHILGIKIGVLTANLATVIFVLTLSHIVFLTFNWRKLRYYKEDQERATKEAIDITLLASFWSMVTTLFGFISLLFVQARPLRELGISGALGTAMAFIVAYTVYPSFLRLKRTGLRTENRIIRHYYHALYRLFDRFNIALIFAIVCIIIVTAPSLKKLDTDPSLLSFFRGDSEISEGLKYIDRNGGSSPLVLVLESKTGNTLNTNKVYRRLWALQKDLEKHKDVGTIISLPTLLAEGRRSPLSFFISSEHILSVMERPQNDEIAKSFVTKDRRYGLFLLRMNELSRTKHRLEVIEELKEIIRSHDFNPHLVGGIYALQGRLSKHISGSLIVGLGRLILIFTVIAFFVSFSFRTSIAMTLSISLIPLCIIGGIGFFKIPLDTISAPAANVAIAMGIDAMIHMVHTYRRRYNEQLTDAQNWVMVKKYMWEPIITSMFIVCSGFGIFFFSAFPPTQRFGGAIVFGTIIAAVTALFIFPRLAQRHSHKKQTPPQLSGGV